MGECCAGLPHERLGGPLQGETRIELVCHVDVWEVPYNAPILTAAAQSGTTAFGDAPVVVETHGSEGIPDASNDEEAPDEKSSPTAAVPPSWEELMEMLKGVPCFTDAEAPSTRMSDFFPLTKRVSVNMDGDPPTFIKARLPFGTPESVVSCIQHLQEWTIPKTAEVVVTPLLFFSSSLVVATSSHNIIFCFVVTLPRLCWALWSLVLFDSV